MASVNRVCLLGNVGNDPNSGDNVSVFSLATQHGWKDRDGINQKITDWHTIRVYGHLVETVRKFVKKGDPLYLEGRLTSKRNDDGTVQSSVMVDKLEMLGKLSKDV